VLSERASLLVQDTQADEAFKARDSIVGQHVQSVMAVPLQTSDRVIGLINVDSRAFARPFTPGDLDLLTVLANVAASLRGALRGSDVLVRYFAEKIRPLAGKNILVENRPGASGNIGIEYVAKAKPDGHTILVHGAGGVAASMSLFKRPPVDVTKTIQLAATINRQAFMIVVDARSPYKTLSDLTAAVKPKGDKASYATAARYGRMLPKRSRRPDSW